MNGLHPHLHWAFLAWAFVAGTAVGSFLNVIVARVPAGQSIVRPRSRCPACLSPIGWYDNVPIVSWIVLRARCRSCKAPIPFRYPLVELLGGLTAVVVSLRHGPTVQALVEFVFVASLIALSFIDLGTWLLPHALTIPLLVSGLAFSAMGLTGAGTFAASATGAAAGWMAFATIAFLGEKLLRKEALGFGDVWLLAAIGGWAGLAALLPVVLLASVQGTVVGLVLIAIGRSQPGPASVTVDSETPRQEPPPDPDSDWVPPRNAVPFGPFLALGAVEWLWLQGWIARAVPALSIFR